MYKYVDRLKSYLPKLRNRRPMSIMKSKISVGVSETISYGWRM